MKSKKGITLIALVITIIILIILAGISIAILGGEDGLIAKAKEAGQKQKVAEIKEKLGLEFMAAETEAFIDRGEVLERTQRDDIASKYGEVNGDILTTTDGGYEIDLKEIYNKTLSESGSYTALKQALANTQNDLNTSETNLQAAQMSQSEASAQLSALQTTLASMTATPADVLSDKTIYDTSDGTVKAGTIENKGTLDWIPTTSTTYTVQAGYYNGGTLDSTSAYSAGQGAGDKTHAVRMQIRPNGNTWPCYFKLTVDGTAVTENHYN